MKLLYDLLFQIIHQKKMFTMLILVLAVMLCEGSATTYFVKPNHGNYSNKNAHTLGYYLTNHKLYFTSYTKLQFLPGIHHLHYDLVLQYVKNFTMWGNGNIIQCDRLPVLISAVDVINLTIKNIDFVDCGRRHNVDIKETKYNYSGVLYFNNCTSVVINNTSIIANSNVSGIVAINFYVGKISSFTWVTVVLNCDGLSPVNGIEFTYNDYNYKTLKKKKHFTGISHYFYKTNGLCRKSYALHFVMVQKNYSALINIQDTNFDHLCNSSILYYYGESCGLSIDNNVTFINCSFNHNYGNFFLKLNIFYILVNSDGYIFSSIRDKGNCDRQLNIVNFRNCHFANNSYMNSIIYFHLKGSLSINANVDIRNSSFLHNKDVQIIHVKSEVEILWQLSNYIIVMATNFSSNTHTGMVSMISSTNGLIKLSDYVTIKNNTYEYIIQLYFSVLRYQGYIEFSSNFARRILRANQGSYYLLKEYTILNITNNLVYSATKSPVVYNEYFQQICYYQFISDRGNLDEEFTRGKTLNYIILLVNNIYTAPEHQINYLDESDCTWLPKTAFKSTNSSDVYHEVVETKILWGNKTVRESVKSSVCLCSTAEEFNCNRRQLGTVFPGQTLQVALIIQGRQQPGNNVAMKAETKNYKHACKITDVLEITQSHPIHTCNKYHYTVWSDLHECELYLGDEDTPEVLYVTLNPCPLGFTPQESKKACYCDPDLNPFTISCNLDDETILRPAKSWISGERFNNYSVYLLSRNCPFDHCLPHASNVKLSTPDKQCQFKISGVLCGHCQPGLSVVFGSSHCKQCSSVWLLIVIPIAIAGLVLVVIFFGCNLTVTNGVINTFIFYVNIISINFSVVFPKCYSVCVLLALLNLDLGLETCFYNGMDAFSKTCLQLVFPFYLVLITIALVIGSRYSNKIQRLTAQRALPVLATLFLLIYTKLLITVCSVLFFFSPITHLPSDHITFVWSVDTNVPLFGIRFSILFTLCLVLFLILFPFNILLLFPRKLSHFHFINTFKPLLDAYLGPYKDGFPYWMGLQLLLRAVFLGLSALDRDETLTIGTIVLGVMVCVEGFVQPFKSRFKNIQESLVMLNLLAVYVTALHYNGSRQIEPLLLQCLILTMLAYFVVYIVCHCVMSTCGSTIKPRMNAITMYFKAWKRRIVNDTSAEMLNVTVSESNKIKDVVCSSYEEFQESLIAFND